MGVFKNFFREGAPRFNFFLTQFFGRIILKHIENNKSSRGVRGMLPRKIFENLHTVGAILVLFEQSLGKFRLKFLPLILSVAPYMMHVVRTGRLHFRLGYIFDYANGSPLLRRFFGTVLHRR